MIFHLKYNVIVYKNEVDKISSSAQLHHHMTHSDGVVMEFRKSCGVQYISQLRFSTKTFSRFN